MEVITAIPVPQANHKVKNNQRNCKEGYQRMLVIKMESSEDKKVESRRTKRKKKRPNDKFTY